MLELRKICFPAIKDSLPNADLIAQHLLVRSADGLLCGAYRVTLSHQVKAFESEEDFILGDLPQKPGVKVELAWACVHPDYCD